jgi:hypothetical protein
MPLVISILFLVLCSPSSVTVEPYADEDVEVIEDVEVWVNFHWEL